MQNTVQEFKVGDKFIVTKQSFRDQGYTEVYTVSKTDSFGMIHFLNHDNEEALVYINEIEHYTPEPEKHIHHDLIVAWAKDPKGCIIQWYDPNLVKWRCCIENKPSWSDELTYRIKPKTKEVTRWKWVVKTIDGKTYFVTDAEYTEEEAKKTFKHFTGIKIPDSAVTAIEEV